MLETILEKPVPNASRRQGPIQVKKSHSIIQEKSFKNLPVKSFL
jgi:hypothetical protein